MQDKRPARTAAFHPSGNAARRARTGGPLAIALMVAATMSATVGIMVAGPATADGDAPGYVESIGTPADMWTIAPELATSAPTPTRTSLPEDPARFTDPDGIDSAFQIINVDIVTNV